jgi:hypothetical protein
MPEVKKRPFLFTDDEGTEYEIHGTDEREAIGKARSYAQANKVRLTSQFDVPEDFSEQPAGFDVKGWLGGLQKERQTKMGETSGVGDILGALTLGKAPGKTAAYAGMNALDTKTEPQNEGNRLLRDILRFAPGAAMGSGGAAAANLIGGRLFDKLFKENNSQAPGKGEVSAEILGAAIPGASRVSKLLAKNPITTNVAAGAATAGLASQDRTTPTAPAMALGGATALGGSLLGKGLQRGLQALPSIENPKALATLQGLGYSPETIPQERQSLQNLGGTMKEVSEAASLVDKLKSVKERIKTTKARVEKARTLESAQAENKKVSALKEVLAGAENPDLSKLEKAKGKAVLQDAESYQDKLKAVKQKNEFALRDREIAKIAAGEEFDRISDSGYDPRNLAPNQKAAVDLLATEHPEEITARLLSQPDKALSAVKGISELFGPKSEQLKSVRNHMLHRLFTDSIDDNAGKFSGRALSGHKIGEFLNKLPTDVVEELFGNKQAVSKLRELENMLTRSSKLREPSHSFRVLLTPGGMGAAAGLAMGGAENALPYTGVGLVLGSTLLGAWKTIPAMLDDAMRKDTNLGKLLTAYGSTKSPGSTVPRIVSKFVGKTGVSTQEQTTADDQK